MKTLLLWMAWFAMSLPVMAQSYTEKISKELAFATSGSNNTFMLMNINGSIKVEGYAGNKILVEATRRITSKTAEGLEQGKQNLKLGTLSHADTVIVYLEGTGATFRKKEKQEGWGYDWCCNNGKNCGDCDCKTNFDYEVDFIVKVPAASHLHVSTINNGNIDVTGMKGKVNAANINGGVNLAGLEQEARVTAINGNVDIEYASNPKKDCRFYTLNGDINAWFRKGLAANMTFESFNGNLYTNVDKLEALPIIVEKQSTPDGMKFKLNNNHYKIGSGGVSLDFETFNGSVYVKEK